MSLSKEFVERFLLNYFKCTPDYMISVKNYDNDNEYLQFKYEMDNITVYENDYFMFDGHIYKIRTGATKITFIFDDFDEVIKIPFNGVIIQEENEESDCYEEYRNHLESENQIYDNSPIKEILLRNTFLMNFGGVKVYTQKKIDSTFKDKYINDKISKEAWKKLPKKIKSEVNVALTKRTERNSYLTLIPAKKFLADIIEFYKNGIEIIVTMDFLDMHSNNYGYIGRQPVIFDYSGYSDRTDEDYN